MITTADQQYIVPSPGASRPCPAEGPWLGQRPERSSVGAIGPREASRVGHDEDKRPRKGPRAATEDKQVEAIQRSSATSFDSHSQCPFVPSYDRCGVDYSRCSNKGMMVNCNAPRTLRRRLVANHRHVSIFFFYFDASELSHQSPAHRGCPKVKDKENETTRRDQ